MDSGGSQGVYDFEARGAHAHAFDAFVAGRPLSGNPAAVMPLDRWLDD